MILSSVVNVVGWFSDQGWLVSIHPSIHPSNYQPTMLLSAYHASSLTKNGCKGGSPVNPSIRLSTTDQKKDTVANHHQLQFVSQYVGTPESNGSADFPIEIAVAMAN